MKDFFRHLFFPSESNNHRAKILHHSSLLVVILFFLVGQFIVAGIQSNYSQVLGQTTNISPEVLLLLTNKYREQNGLSPLSLHSDLSQAALLKVQYMLENNYWAHNAPDGTTPWVFVKQVGYEYAYAGENLARGFATSEEVVDAWMASPSHKENMLSGNYEDIGFAVLEGKLLGEDTTLVVEMFGSTRVLTQQQKDPRPEAMNEQVYEKPEAQIATVLPSVTNYSFIDSFSFTRSIGMLTLAFIIFVLIFDIVIVKRRNIARLVGHNLDHILFLSAILILILVIQQGVVL